MAIATDKIVLYFELRAGRKIDQELAKVKGKVRRWNHSLVAEMRNIFKRATIFRFSTIAINSFFNSLSYARGEAVKFQSAMANIIKLDLPAYNNLASSATIRLGEEIGRLAAKYNVARTDAAGAYKTILTAGFRGAEATKLFNTTLLAQASAGLSANNAISLLIATMKQFDVGVNSTEQALDTLLAIQSKAAIGFDEFSGAFRTGGAALSEVTENLSQAGAIIAAISERTRESGAVTGTFLKTLQARIVGRAATRKQFESLGIKIEENGKLRPFVALLGELNDKIKDMGAARRGEIYSIISGQRQVNRLINATKALGRMRELEIEGNKAAGEARRRAAIEAETFAAKWNKTQIEFVQGVEGGLLPIMDKFVEHARSLGRVVAWVAQQFINAMDMVDPKGAARAANREAEQTVAEVIKELLKKVKALPSNERGKIGGNIEARLNKLLTYANAGPENAPSWLAGFMASFARGNNERALEFARNIGGVVGIHPSKFKEKNYIGQEDLENVARGIDQFIGIAEERKRPEGVTTQTIQKEVTAFITQIKKVESAMERSAKTGSDAAKEELRQYRIALETGGTLKSPGAMGGEKYVTATLKDIFSGTDESFKLLEKRENDMALVNSRLSDTYEQILEPAKNFNDALLSQRKKLENILSIEGGMDQKGLKRVADQMERYEELFKQGKISETTLEDQRGAERVVKGEVLLRQRQREAKLLEFDANALRRLNTRLAGLKDGARDASAQVASASKSLNEARKNEIRSMEQIASATASLKAAIGQYQVGLMMARVEAGKITGAIGGLAQELASVENIGKVIDGEMRLDTLRRDSLSYQLDLVQSIIQKQQQIGMSYLTGGIEQRTDIFRGFGALQNMFGKFGGDVGSFNQLSDTDMNDFGRMILSLPADVRKAMVDALGFLPEGGTIAGFTSEQLRSMLSSAALGRGGTVSNVQDLQKRAAEATVELARLNTDGLSVAMQQYQTANKQLDQATAQTELQKIRVAQAREQMNITLQTSREQRDHIEKQMAAILGKSTALRGSQLDEGTANQRIMERTKANKEALDAMLADRIKESPGAKGAFQSDLSGITGGMMTNVPKAYQEYKSMGGFKEEDGVLINIAKNTEKSAESAKEFIEIKGILTNIADETKNSTTKLREYLDRQEKNIANAREAIEVAEIGERDVRVMIEVANALNIKYADAAEIPYLVAETVKNLPEVKDFNSFKGALRTIVSAIATSINTGQPLDPGVLGLISGTAVQ